MDRFARAKKRKSTDIRNDQREKGAFPIRMFFPEDRDAAIMAGSENHAAWRNPANEAVATPGSFAPVSETDYPTYLWGAQRMASKGFLVTKTGCLIPDKRWCEKGKGSTAKGYQLMFGAMYAATTIPLKKGSEGADKAAELQHGCHNHACCNTDHIWIEPAYRNRKRNYCGRDGDGCTCGGEPPCLEPYSSSHSSKGSASTGDIEEADLCQSWEEVDLALNKHLYALKWEPSTWELLEASKAGHASQKKALEGAAKRRKASRPADENTPENVRRKSRKRVY